MTEFLQYMTHPFLACLLLAGIHVYLGIHVIERKVIFVDLALAQIAALGAVYGMLLGYETIEDPWILKGFSLAFTFLGATMFSLTRMKRERVPHEAIIGITYAVALAATILASTHLPHGADAIRDLLAGSILWVSEGTIRYAAILYGAVGVFHYACRKKFLMISINPRQAEAEGINIRLWDFLFYMAFGLVVTSSVSMAGVLLVFSYLVIPAVMAALFADRVRSRLIIGWVVGTVVSFLGVVISYNRNLPSGPTIVVGFAVCLIGAGIVYYLVHTASRMQGVLKICLAVAGCLLLIKLSLLLQKQEKHDWLGMAGSPLKNERLMALRTADKDQACWDAMRQLVPALLHDAEPEIRSTSLALIAKYHAQDLSGSVYPLLTDQDDMVREAAVQCIAAMRLPESVSPLMAAIEQEGDDFIKVEMAGAMLQLGDIRAMQYLIDVMDKGAIVQVRKEAYSMVASHLPPDMHFHPESDADANDMEIHTMRTWWQEHQNRPAPPRPGHRQNE